MVVGRLAPRGVPATTVVKGMSRCDPRCAHAFALRVLAVVGLAAFVEFSVLIFWR